MIVRKIKGSKSMNFFIVNVHWDNRGDEAAIRSMLMELLILSKSNTVSIQRAIGKFGYFPKQEKVSLVNEFPKSGKKGVIEYYLALLTNGKILLSKESKDFYRALKRSDLVLHAPGGPSIGDIYLNQETTKLRRLRLVIRAKKKLMFYAPSMGPFENEGRNKTRRYILNHADKIVLREAISKGYLEKLGINKEAIITLDSAFQYDFPVAPYVEQFNEYRELSDFVKHCDGKVLGMTVTDLLWNSKYKNSGTDRIIRESFTVFIDWLIADGWGIVFIPQLFGNGNDFAYMESFVKQGCMVVDDKYDCFFQQYVISKMNAVIGMRYHSNIFSAKMATPFISVSYEQKMSGFMDKAGISEYCLDINDLSYDSLKSKFEKMICSYDEYKALLVAKKSKFKAEAYQTTRIAVELVGKREENK